MANYILLYHGGGMPATEEEKNNVMVAWGEWQQQFGENIVDFGNPTSNVVNVDKNGENEFSGDRVTGYSTIRAEGMANAVNCARMVPIVSDGGSVDVYETFKAM
ncbi:MAG: hypothetical protein NVS1B10_05700 [Candidatus Saccharimonadales bacterium]